MELELVQAKAQIKSLELAVSKAEEARVLALKEGNEKLAAE